MKVYLVRHGQTSWNIQGIAQGRTNIPLNLTGIKQARELQEKIKTSYYSNAASATTKANTVVSYAKMGSILAIYDSIRT